MDTDTSIHKRLLQENATAYLHSAWNVLTGIVGYGAFTARWWEIVQEQSHSL